MGLREAHIPFQGHPEEVSEVGRGLQGFSGGRLHSRSVDPAMARQREKKGTSEELEGHEAGSGIAG
jgi:hypothetical protein